MRTTRRVLPAALAICALVGAFHGFMITIEAKKTHKPVAYKHEGEEFIFVLEGHLELTVGSKTQDLKPGESVSGE